MVDVMIMGICSWVALGSRALTMKQAHQKKNGFNHMIKGASPLHYQNWNWLQSEHGCSQCTQPVYTLALI